MAPRLRVLAGPSLDDLTPITHLVNTSSSFKVSSELFEGEISVHIKDFVNDRGEMRRSDYFDREDRQGITWSIQTSGECLILWQTIAQCYPREVFGSPERGRYHVW